MKNEILAIIPARGGSKGIPQKNLKEVGNRPLVGIAIDNARETRQINRVVVSTDDSNIERTANAFGAEVIRRPENISGDRASSESALLHALHYLHEKESYHPDIIVFLQCTSPLILPEDIDKAISMLLDRTADVVFSAVEVHQFLWQETANGEAGPVNHDQSIRLMRQDLKPQFKETGAIYVMRAKGFMQAKHRFFGRVLMSAIPENRAVDIDEPADLAAAQALYQYNRDQRTEGNLPAKPQAIVFDFDGVFTDNRVVVSEEGTESVLCNRSDGLGIERLRAIGIPMVVISSEQNRIVKVRCDKLKIPCIFGVDNKLTTLKKWLGDNGISSRNIIYVGNDINDMECMQYAGCSVAVRDAAPEIKEMAGIILQSNGGRGAIRELSDRVVARVNLSKRGKCDEDRHQNGGQRVSSLHCS